MRPIIYATFPDYGGKKIQVRAAETVTVHGLNWTGGSRNRYAACTLDGRATGNADAGNAALPWRNPVEGQTVAVPPGFAVVEHCMFCGKDLGLRIYVTPGDMPRLLPAPVGDELSEQEKAVLKIIRSLISSYRREKARSLGISAEEYFVLCEALKAKGLLSANGGLSLAGKNAAVGL